MLKFQNKVALITGSGTGIGQAIAKKFVENGASVIILGRRKEPLEETAKILNKKISDAKSGAFVKIFPGVDVADEKSINNMFESLKMDGIIVDFVINNAGVSGPVTCFVSSPFEEFKNTIGIHLTGTFWTSVQALQVMKEGGKIITISTFFTEERPLEQRPYRFRSPYTASQGAKNRLAEALSWELVNKKIISIATNPGPVHSDRIYKTVYPKAASEFMRVSGFEDLTPMEVDIANGLIVPLLGENEKIVQEGIENAAKSIATNTGKDLEKLKTTLNNLLNKIQTIAEKIQNNTSHMIADKQFLSQSQVAETVLNLCEDEIAKILNGKVIPGDRVFYPVKPHVGTLVKNNKKQDIAGKVIVLTVDATNETDCNRAIYLAKQLEDRGGKPICFVSESTPVEYQKAISEKFHSHVINLKETKEITKWFDTAKTKLGEIFAVIHLTGSLDNVSKLTELSRDKWESLVEKFIITPANVSQRAIQCFVPNGEKDPRLFKEKSGAIMIIGPDLPTGKKISGLQRAQIEVFRGALRPFTTTVNQELSDVLKSNIRLFLVLPGSITGTEPDNSKIMQTFDFLISDDAASSSEVIFCVDEKR